jgi:hypothetical protein
MLQAKHELLTQVALDRLQSMSSFDECRVLGETDVVPDRKSCPAIIFRPSAIEPEVGRSIDGNHWRYTFGVELYYFEDDSTREAAGIQSNAIRSAILDDRSLGLDGALARFEGLKFDGVGSDGRGKVWTHVFSVSYRDWFVN